MAKTPSTMIPLGTPAPDFSLVDTVTGKQVSLATTEPPPATVIMFICNHCPFVIHILPALLVLSKKYQTEGVRFIGISSNDATTYPEDGPDNMRKTAETLHFPFPYLYDATQTVAKAYQAACTPDFYVFDNKMACVYRGRFDDTTPGNQRPVTGRDLSEALDAILAGNSVPETQMPSVGCNIKWKK
ncbi:MAG TPA: thioredoxin family protein [Gammaproteobacteria bacterium]|jgi:peroxiredoxin|nr:thioredoxin family protein [Gammaproteobacteria bacterium]